MLSQGLDQFDVATVGRPKEVRAHKQENDVRPRKAVVDLVVPLCACRYQAVMPPADETPIIGRLETMRDMVNQRSVLVCVGKKHLDLAVLRRTFKPCEYRGIEFELSKKILREPLSGARPNLAVCGVVLGMLLVFHHQVANPLIEQVLIVS